MSSHVGYHRIVTRDLIIYLGEGGSRDELASHPAGVEILLVTSCWVSCRMDKHHMQAGYSNAPPCWVFYDGLAFQPGVSSNILRHMLGFLQRGAISSNTYNHFMLGILWWTNILSGGGGGE